MSTLAEKLKKRRREEQEIRSYANSSRWYTGLSNAISFLERAETESDALSRFSDAWSVAYNLFMMHGDPGDEEYRRFNSWVSTLKDYAGVRHYFVSAGDPLITAFRQAVDRAKKVLLKADGLQSLESWLSKGVSPEKGPRNFFLIIRDIRNTAFHPEFNPSTATVKKALAAAAECLIPIVAAAVEATIEHPVPHTTGKATAYRFFLYPFLKNSDGFFSDYYLERLFPDDELGNFPDDQAKDLFKEIAKSLQTRESGLRTADTELTIANWLEPVLFKALGVKPIAGVRIIAEDAVFQPTFVLPKAENLPTGDPTDLIDKDANRVLACLIWTLPWRASLDSIATDPLFVGLPVTEVVNRALIASDVPWAMITNGRQMRLLSRATSHKPRCFLEADLIALIDRRTDQQALRAFRFALGLFSAPSFTEIDATGNSLLDRVTEGSDRHGKEIGDELKANVFSALQELGEGFLAYMRATPSSTDTWRDERAPKLSREKFLRSDVLLEDIYHESLSLMYRLLFLFYAESRELLPLDNELYQSYSLESIRDDVQSVQDDPDPRQFFGKGKTDLWGRLKELFGFLDQGWGKVIPPYNGGLFDPEKHAFLQKFAVGDYYLARAIDLLSRTKPRIGQSRGEGRKKVTYRDLDVRHLGSIYEGILEYTASIADQDYVILRHVTSGTEIYKAKHELNATEKAQLAEWRRAVEESPDNPRPPRTCKVTGQVETGQYYLISGGRESKRKSSGSYYTPDYVVQYIVENTLGPLVRGDCRPKPESPTTELKSLGWVPEPEKTGPLSSEELLDLKILDPAMGSGHFLVAVTEYLARVYRDAKLAEGSAMDETKADQEFVHFKRTIAERCVYGVDNNPMAVELAKLSMWLFTMDPGRPLSFLDHHFKVGNALLGAQISDLGKLPQNGLPPALSHEHEVGQRNMFEPQFRSRLPAMLSKVFGIVSRETSSTQDIQDKKTLDEAISSLRQPFRHIADIWTASFFGEDARDYLSLLSNVERAKDLVSPTAERMRFFHWELEFPELFFTKEGNWLDEGGFSGVVGNPPWGAPFSDSELGFLRSRNQPVIVRMIDSFMYFVYGSAVRIRRDGMLGMIVPDSLLYQKDCGRLREFLLATNSLRRIVHVGEAFEGVVRPAAVFISRIGQSDEYSIQMKSISKVPIEAKPAALSREDDYIETPRSVLLKKADATLSIESSATTEIWTRIHDATPLRLKDILDPDGIQRGVSPDLKDAFLVSSADAKIHRLERSLLKPVLTGGKNVKRYGITYPDLLLIYTTRDTDFEKFPNICRYIEQFSDRITCREVKEGKHSFYALHRAREERIFLKETKFVGVITEDEIVVARDNSRTYATDGLYVFGIKESVDPDYLMGLLNSRLFVFIYRQLTMEQGRALAQVKPTTLLGLPIRIVSEKNGWQRDAHDEIVSSVRALAKIVSSSMGSPKAGDQQKMRLLQDRIDQGFFRLYGLKSADIDAIVTATSA